MSQKPIDTNLHPIFKENSINNKTCEHTEFFHLIHKCNVLNVSDPKWKTSLQKRETIRQAKLRDKDKIADPGAERSLKAYT